MFLNQPFKFHVLAFKDILLDVKDNTFSRNFINKDKRSYFFKNKGIDFIEVPQFYPYLPINMNGIKDRNMKFGALKFETHLNSEGKFICHCSSYSFKVKEGKVPNVKFKKIYLDM